MDKITHDQRSANMRAIRSVGMKPEMTVRRLAHKLGYRYRLHRHDLPGRPDMVFVSRRKIIFVNGCFWHQHDDATCPIARKPKSNKEYWLPKLWRTVARDKKNWKVLSEAGWTIEVIWECQTKNEGALKRRLTEFLE